MRRVSGVMAGVLAAVALLAAPASAQVTNGRIRGHVMDETGAAMSGVTVTLESAALFQPMVRVTTVSGWYEFPGVPIGTYTVSFELTDFKRVVRTGVVVATGFQAEINARLEAGGPGDTVTISDPSPIVGTGTSTSATFTREVMDNVPTARDPWQIVNMAAGVQASDLNVGGNLSGQQVTFTARGQGQASTMWNVDGATVTDMAATGVSPDYFDFESFQEIHVTTGGADASVQTGGININVITRSGSNLFSGSARGVYSDDNVQWQNVTEELFEQGAGSGAPIKYYREYGAEAGGPIVRDRAWWWFAGARQDINGSVLGFHDPVQPGCDPPPGGFANLESNQDCLKDDLTFIYNYSGKLNDQPSPSNRLQFLYTYGSKTRNARGATQDLAPESVHRQANDGRGSFFFKHTWEATDELVVDSLVQYADAGFSLLPQVGTEDRQRLVIRETGFTSRGLFTEARAISRPTTEVKTDGSIFLANLLGGDHTTRFGVRYRDTPWRTDTFWTGGAEARLSTRFTAENPRYGSVNEGGPLGPDRAELYRPGSNPTGLWTVAAYLQDSYTRGRLRLNVGVRWDYQNDEAKAGCIDANPIVPDLLPARCFDGADYEVNFSDLSPRLSAAYDLPGTGRTVLRGGYAQYYGQRLRLSTALSQLGAVTLTFQNARARTCWDDANGDTFVQRGELNLAESGCLLFTPGAFDPETGLRPGSMDEVDPDLKNERTQEITAGVAQELAPNLAVGIDYVHRVYDQFSSSIRTGETKDMWVAREWTDADAVAAGQEPPSAFGLPANGWIYYEFNPGLARPSGVRRTQNVDERRVYDGVDLTLRKRFSGRWMMNAAVTLQRRIDDPIFCLDCTNIDKVEGLNNQTAYIVKLNGMYALPKDFNVSANLQIEQGENRLIQFDGPPTAFRAGGISGSGFPTTLDPVRFTAFAFGTEREPLVHLLDAQVTKTIALRGGRHRLSLTFSVFNVLNANTARGYEDDLNDPDFGRVTGILAPRVARFLGAVSF